MVGTMSSSSSSGSPKSAGPRVIVVGAGAVGLSCALFLAKGGAAVTLVEAQGRGLRAPKRRRAASANAAGMLGAYSEALYEGSNTHRLFARFCAAGHAAWERLLLAHPLLEAGVRDTGSLLLAHSDADLARVMRVRDRARQAGAQFEWTDGLPDDLDPHLYSLRVVGALRLPEERLVDVGAMLELLTEHCIDAGVSLLVERDEAGLQELIAHRRRALPGARFESPPRFHAAGVRPMSPDWAPMIGPSGPEGCFVACGHSRNGWLLGPLTGQILAAQVLAQPLEDLWTAFSPDRFEKKAA